MARIIKYKWVTCGDKKIRDNPPHPCHPRSYKKPADTAIDTMNAEKVTCPKC